MEKLQDVGLTLNSEKCIFVKDGVPFWGLLLNHEGIKPEPSKAEALRHASPPQNKEEIMSFLCMIQSQSNFIPNLSCCTAHLRDLNKKPYSTGKKPTKKNLMT